MQLLKIWLNPALLTIALATSSLPGQATTPEKQGLAIAQASKDADQGWRDMTTNIEMILRNAHGQESRREIRMQALEIVGDGDKSLITFDQPRDVRGTAFLSHSNPVGADDQWLYLPALGRVKRIASRNKSGPFMGSEFAYEDLSSFEVEKYTYKYLRKEPCGDDQCHVLELYPVDQYSGYTRQISWIDESELRIRKTEYYDRKNSLLKTLDYIDYRQHLGKYWRPSQMTMVNHQTGKHTDLVYSNYQFKTGLDEGDFSIRALRRAR